MKHAEPGLLFDQFFHLMVIIYCVVLYGSSVRVKSSHMVFKIDNILIFFKKKESIDILVQKPQILTTLNCHTTVSNKFGRKYAMCVIYHKVQR